MQLTWPAQPPRHGEVFLRRFEDRDVDMVRDLSTDPYIPLIGSLPAHATHDQALGHIARQRGRFTEGAGYSFCVARVRDDVAVGGVGLWLKDLEDGRASAGWAIAPACRGRGFAAHALSAVVGFAWTLDGLHRVEAYIEPWNTASARVARTAGLACEGTLRSYLPIGDRRADMDLYAITRGRGGIRDRPQERP